MNIKTKKLTQTQTDNLISAAYAKYGDGVQVHIMDILKIFDEARLAINAGDDIEVIMPLIIKKYRLN